MAKPRRKQRATPANGELKESNYTSRLFEDGRKLHELKLACGRLKRVAQPGPVHLQKFIDRVFALAGVTEQAATAGEAAPAS